MTERRVTTRTCDTCGRQVIWHPRAAFTQVGWMRVRLTGPFPKSKDFCTDSCLRQWLDARRERAGRTESTRT